MKRILNDKWSRIAALKPVTRIPDSQSGGAGFSPPDVSLANVGSSGACRLVELLGAETPRNHYGEFVRTRQWFPEPAPAGVSSSAVTILAKNDSTHDDFMADPRNWLFLDTETTGLAGGTGTYAFLIGLAWWDANGLQVEQLFMRDYAEEHSLLAALAERLAERRVLVTFNGKTFDWPLLETRFRMTRQIFPQPASAHLDLLHPSRQVWRLRLGSVRLCELERYVLGFDRGPDLWSAVIPQLYFEYLRRGEEAAHPLAEVFRHNVMDLRGLALLATKLCALLHEPELAEADPLDLLGLSRLLRSRGHGPRARAVYERALAAGLPGALARAARRELALLAKRDRDFARATSLWEDLSTNSADFPEENGADFWNLEAYEQLAIYYERRAKQPHRAAELTRDALRAVRQASSQAARSPARYARLLRSLELRLARLEHAVQDQSSFRSPAPNTRTGDS